MGCCEPNELSQEITVEEIEEYNKLNSEIDQILTNKNDIDIYNSDSLLKLINKISVKISNCKEIIRKIKLKRFSSKFSGDTLRNLKNIVKQLNEYSKHLNEQNTENRKENLLRENMILKELGTNTIITVNESKLKTNPNNEKSLDSFVYHKKCIRRNTKEITS